MSYLNGEVSGVFNNKTDINHIDIISGYDANNNPIKETKSLVINEIIKQVLHKYGNESFHNIIINDLEDYGLELLQYEGTTPIVKLDTTVGGKSYSAINISNDKCVY
jgi:hypothetical protein